MAHWSSCAVNNAPALPVGPCDCGNNAPCQRCDDQGWVCEEHPLLPWGGASKREDACNCGGAGMPCKVCHPADGVDFVANF